MRQGFTLAESLITLGIIGVVAALTIPTLMSKHKEKVFITTLKQTYSIFSQAFIMAEKESGSADTWEIGNGDSYAGAESLYNIFLPHLKDVKSVNGNESCYGITYKSLTGKTFSNAPSSHAAYTKSGILSNGVFFMFLSAGSGCVFDMSVAHTGPLTNICGILFVDLNNVQPPNQAGVDYFCFRVTKSGIFPCGRPDENFRVSMCKYNNSARYNGDSCTYWALSRENMDYLRRDISDEL